MDNNWFFLSSPITQIDLGIFDELHEISKRIALNFTVSRFAFLNWQSVINAVSFTGPNLLIYSGVTGFFPIVDDNGKLHYLTPKIFRLWPFGAKQSVVIFFP